MDNASLGSTKAKAQEESTRLRLELEQVKADFIKEKKDFKVVYQKQVDDMFFYRYNYCMRKHRINGDIPSILFDDEVELDAKASILDDKGSQDKSVQD